MATMAEIREGLAANLSSIQDVQVSAYMLSAPTPPAMHIFPSEIEYDQAQQRGLDIVTMTVQAFVALGVDIAAQITLDELLAQSGVRSVKTAVEADSTLGGKVQDVHVTAATGYQPFPTKDGGAILACSWTVLVYD